MILGGAGKLTNVNANEVIAQRALELLGEPRGNCDVVYPNNHVNLSVPMTLCQEFHAYGVIIGKDVARLRDVRTLLAEINMGAIAIGSPWAC